MSRTTPKTDTGIIGKAMVAAARCYDLPMGFEGRMLPGRPTERITDITTGAYFDCPLCSVAEVRRALKVFFSADKAWVAPMDNFRKF